MKKRIALVFGDDETSHKLEASYDIDIIHNLENFSKECLKYDRIVYILKTKEDCQKILNVLEECFGILITTDRFSLCAENSMGIIDDLENLEQKIEDIYKDYQLQDKLMNKICHAIKNSNIKNIDQELINISHVLSQNNFLNKNQKRIFVDVSVLKMWDSKSGIQRVVKAQLLNLLKKPPKNYKIEPVYLTDKGSFWHYEYAREFAKKYLDIKDDFQDEPIEYRPGDIFYSADLFYMIKEAAKQNIYKKMKAKHVKIVFFVHDTLPIFMSEYFPKSYKTEHGDWIKLIASISDKIICNSKATSDSVIEFLKSQNIENIPYITYIHLGYDIDSAKHIEGIKDEELKALDKIRQNPYFLMVSTIEPRKGHRQVLKAFEKLWKEGYNFNLVFVGKEGWMMGDFIYYISKHPEKNKRFFYLGQVSDDMLEHLYKDASATIMASEGEGFGIPIVESAYHKIPIIARDIPVFREVAKEGAYYFENTKDENVLAKAILDWYELYKQNKHPKPDSVKIMSWEEHTEILKKELLS